MQIIPIEVCNSNIYVNINTSMKNPIFQYVHKASCVTLDQGPTLSKLIKSWPYKNMHTFFFKFMPSWKILNFIKLNQKIPWLHDI